MGLRGVGLAVVGLHTGDVTVKERNVDLNLVHIVVPTDFPLGKST